MDRSPQPNHRSCRSSQIWAGLSLLVLCATPGAADDDPHRVMGAMVTKLTRYVTWNQSSPSAKPGQMWLGVVGAQPAMFNAVSNLLSNRRIGTITWRVRRLRSPADVSGVQVAVLADDPPDFAEWKRAFREAHILTFCARLDKRARDEVFKFVYAERKLGFDVNLAAASAAGLRVDPRLLRLARQVRKE